MSKRVLITGATAFIAGPFSRRMAAEGWEVYGIDRPGTTAPPSYLEIFPVAPGDSMAAVLARIRPDAVLHTALDPVPNRYEVNAGATRRWLEEGKAAGAGVQVLLSSLSAAENAVDEYGRRNWALEQAFHAAGQIAVRPGVVVGNGGAYAELLAFTRRMPVIPLLGGGQQLVNVLGVERLAEILRDMVTGVSSSPEGQGLRARSWNLQQPQPYTLREVVDTIVRVHGLKRVTLTLPIRPMLVGAGLFEKQAVVNLPIRSANIRGLVRAGQRTFPSDYPRFGYTEQSLQELAERARAMGA